MIDFTTSSAVKVNEEQAKQFLADIKNHAMGGWFDLPAKPNMAELEQIKTAAAKIQQDSEVLVCIGIGGSYLGHRALIEVLGNKGAVKVLYTGNSLSSREFNRLLAEIGDRDFSVNVISKSGTTTEPAVAFRLLKARLQQKYGDQANSRIYATTDQAKGALHNEAEQNHYTSFVVPDNIGGRYSVLSAVGLLPLAVAGIDIDGLLAGARAEQDDILARPAESPALKYAYWRDDLRSKGHDVEVLASFEPSLHDFEEWWKQLFGESEGKNHRGIFPAAAVYTTDLHSLGQYLQEGRRNIFETLLKIENAGEQILVPKSTENLDGLQYLEGKSLDYINNTALEATYQAHLDGGIPVSEVILPALDERTFGALIFFFETACAVSAMLDGVNPFDQPGVEAYKNNMFKLLGKPGY